MDDTLYIYFTVSILDQAVKISKSSDIIPMEKHQLQLSSAIQTRTLVFLSFSGDVLMTLENVSKDIYWSSILGKIAKEEWFKTCKRWRFVLGSENLKPNNVLVSDDKLINIRCVKIEPQITFMLSSGQFLVSVPFDSCYSCCDGEVNLLYACFEAHKKLKKLGKDGYGRKRTKIHPLYDTNMYCANKTPRCGEHTYVFRDKNGNELDMYEDLEDPGDENLLIMVDPKEVYCSHKCETKFHGPLRIGEQRKVLREKISVCTICSFLHCPSCGMYLRHKIGTSECCASRDM
jgi:hypothetical protein